MYLDVPFREKDHAKSLGACWDRQSRLWYVPSGLGLLPFSKWLPVSPSPDDPLLAIVGLPRPCWKCGEPTMAVVACKEDGHEHLVFADSEVLQILASQISVRELSAVGAGPLRPRFSHTMGRSSWSNGCVACGALLGGFPLYEEFAAYMSDPDPELPVIAYARVPLDALYGNPES